MLSTLNAITRGIPVASLERSSEFGWRYFEPMQLGQTAHSCDQGGVRLTIVVNGTTPNPNRAAQLAKEIEVHKQKVAEAQ